MQANISERGDLHVAVDKKSNNEVYTQNSGTDSKVWMREEHE